MYRFLLPLSLTAVVLPVAAQPAATPGHSSVQSAAVSQPLRVIEGAGPLTLSAALRMALDANADLSAARHELQAVEAAVLQAGVLPNPALEMSVEDRRRETHLAQSWLSRKYCGTASTAQNTCTLFVETFD